MGVRTSLAACASRGFRASLESTARDWEIVRHRVAELSLAELILPPYGGQSYPAEAVLLSGTLCRGRVVSQGRRATFTICSQSKGAVDGSVSAISFP